MRSDGEEEYLTADEVAALFRVSREEVERWRRSGRLHAVRTIRGQRRYRATQVRAMLLDGRWAAGRSGA